ncbi:MAG TPA: tetratricopeptide repeat protein [Labilithrix sp.]
MRSQGDLGTKPLAALVATAAIDGMTGTLLVSDGVRSVRMAFRDGAIASVTTSDGVAYLGGVLYELGAIDMQTLNATLLEVATAKKLHGEVLLARGAITHDELATALVEQTHRKLAYAFGFGDDAKWRIDPFVQDGRDDDRPTVDAFVGLWRALRDTAPTKYERRILERIEGAVQLRDAGLAAQLGLTGEDRAVAESLASVPKTLDELGEHTLGRPRIERLLYFLALARALVRVRIELPTPTTLGRAGVLELAKRVVDDEPHIVLGVARDATPEAVRAAYFRLARIWHPDRIPRELGDLADAFATIFERIAEAHLLLTSGVVRAMLAAPAHADPASATARPTIRDVDKALERNELDRAAAIAASLRDDGACGPDARAALAWIEAGGAAAPEASVAQALAALDKVIAGDPECARAYYYRGVLLRRTGKLELAARDFRKALRIDPRHVDAAREVRLFEMRARAVAGAPTEGKESGLRRLLDRAARKGG